MASEETRVTLCACTYRRPDGLAALLNGLAAQTFERRERPELSVVVVDNQGSAQAKDLCDQFGARSDLAIRYAHEPRRGISHARNACLARLRADCDFFAMIDDDQVPHPDWIEELLLAQQRTDADVVQGRVLPVLPHGTPDWIVAGRYFGADPALDRTIGEQQTAHPQLEKARTGNVLVRHAVVRKLGLRFDPQFALTGGEDIVFFQAIKAAGHRIVHAPDARVEEIVPPDRATLTYLWRMWYRVGCNEWFKQPKRRESHPGITRTVRRQWKSSGASLILRGLARLIGHLTVGRTDMDHLAPGMKLIAHGLGRATSGLGLRYEHYR